MEQTYTYRRGGPTGLWWFVVGVDALLLLAFWMPWVRFAPSEVQQAHYDQLAHWLAPGRNVPALSILLEKLAIPPEHLDFLPGLIGNEGEDLRATLVTRRGVGGGWLLLSPFAAPVRGRLIAQALLIGGVALWAIAGTQERHFQPAPAMILLAFTILLTLAHIFGVPKLETFGHDDNFNLALVMALALARPGLGCWLTLIGNLFLTGSMVAYLGLQSPAWQRPRNQTFDTYGSELYEPI